jgi:Peptide methionine sulfoxide reductase
MDDLLADVIEAHGGLDCWRSVTLGEATIVTGGGLWGLKGLIQDPSPRRMTVSLPQERASGLWPGKVVTELAPAGDFWEAEPEHQDYLKRYPGGYTYHFVRPGWKLPRHSTAA